MMTQNITHPTKIGNARAAADVPRVSAWWLPVILLMSFVAMIPWPASGIALFQSTFENAWEAYFMFGGLTAIPVAYMSILFGGLSNDGFGMILVVVWGLVLVAPPALIVLFRPTRRWIVATLIGQATFSMIQAALGILMVIGKSV